MADQECSRRCGYFGDVPDLVRHEREDHARCPDCGREPGGERGEYPVSHKPGCSRFPVEHALTGEDGSE